MFQSGHRRYDQRTIESDKAENDDDPEPDSSWKGEDNWRYVLEDLSLANPKPTLDGEPSYEGIPQGLHDFTQPRWTDVDIRRYAYWSVLAGACGFTYGHNAIMQMYKPQFAPGSFGVSETWEQALSAPGAGQMQHLRNLMENLDYRNGTHAPEILVGNPGKKYRRLLANNGPRYVLVYAYTPQPITVDLDRVSPGSADIRVQWLNPMDGMVSEAGIIPAGGKHCFNPPADAGTGPENDRLLLLTW